MKNMVNLKTLFLVGILFFAVILVSGCISAEEEEMIVTEGDALDLAIDAEGRTTYDSLEEFMITVKAENLGSFDAENVQARLHGYGGIASGEGETLSGLKDLTPKLLDRPDPEREMPGGSGDVDWGVFAPEVGKTAPDLELTLTGEVVYDYKSLATQKVVIVTRDYIKQQDERGEPVPVNPATESLNGPVSIDVDAADPYVKMVGSTTEFRVKVTLDNIGSGNIYRRSDSKYDYLTKVTMRVPVGIAVDEDNCDFDVISGDATDYNDEQTLVLDTTHSPTKLRMTEGGSTRDLHCRLMANQDTGYNTYELYISAYYTYLQDISKKLIIHGTEEVSLEGEIVSPAAGAKTLWNVSLNGTNVVQFKATRAADAVTSGLTTTNTKIKLFNDADSTGWVAPVSLSYNSPNWEAVVNGTGVPAHVNGTVNDLSVKITYAGSTVTETVTEAFNCTE